ncbi:hypothetical protein [Pseudaestuariivita rosea]|uniref:hypothetical protein n=1 Tax=Pseudaestuariivita rosea TaxID=2763263 RepID=UPI001ABA10FE|nr:hypothetical protein [Pseudaestuariivita rosea]
MELPDKGFRFKGVQSSFFYTGFTPGSGISGGISSSSEIVFYHDGTFTSDHFSGAFDNFDNGGGFATSKETNDVRDRYEVGDGVIRMQMPDGQITTQPFFLDADNGIILDGEPLSDE